MGLITRNLQSTSYVLNTYRRSTSNLNSTMASSSRVDEANGEVAV